MNKIVFDFYGKPEKNSICRSTGHGYKAYVCTNNQFIKQIFKESCMWGGATDRYELTYGSIFDMYELDCRNKCFFTSPAFEHICSLHEVEVVIYDEDNDHIRDFWDNVRHR